MFKVGEKVVCINNGKIEYAKARPEFKIGHTYEVMDISHVHGVMISMGNRWSYTMYKRFISLKEYRKRKLKKILI